MLQHIHFIGFGLIGGSLAAAIKKFNPTLFLSAESIDNGPQWGLDNGFLNERLSVPDLKNPDETLIILATPLEASIEWLTRLASLRYDGWITDIGSVKAPVAQKATQLGLRFFGGHPMAGSEKKGAQATNALLFENAVYILCPPEMEPLTIYHDFIDLLTRCRVMPIEMAADLHDEIAARVSHVPQLLATLLVNWIGGRQAQNTHYFQLAAGGFRDMTRIASGPFHIWRDIFHLNRHQIREALHEIKADMDQLDTLLESENWDRLGHLFKQANHYRSEIPFQTKGFINPLFDLLVFVEDKPGVVYDISKALLEKNINIRDIELLKVREGSDGAFKLSFQSRTELEMAAVLLKQSGFKTQFLS